MVRLTIDESVEEELLYIGRALGAAGLRGRIGQRIDGVNAPDISLERYPSRAEKAAHKRGMVLWVSWAELPRESVKAYEAALIQRYLEQHCCMPSFKPSERGIREIGNARVEHLIEHPENLYNLDWSDWHVLYGMSKHIPPLEPGVYRITARILP